MRPLNFQINKHIAIIELKTLNKMKLDAHTHIHTHLLSTAGLDINTKKSSDGQINRAFHSHC